MYFLSLENDMQKTEHQRRMEHLAEDQLYEAARAADASAEAARQARIQAEVAEKQAEFQRNVMILEAADDDERSSFFMNYRKDELNANSKKMYFGVVKEVFKDAQQTSFYNFLSEAKKISQRLESIRVASAEAGKKLSEGQTKYYAIIGFSAVAAYILYDAISMAFYGFNPFGFWSILSVIYVIFAYRYYKAWNSDIKENLQFKVRNFKSEEAEFVIQVRKCIAEINSLWSNGGDSEIMESYIKSSDPRALTTVTAEHIIKVQKDFPATCRVYHYDELLSDSSSEKWFNFEVQEDEIRNDWKDYHACFIKGYLLKYFSLGEWADEILPGVEVITP